jgi:hypothetical protein
MQQPEEHIHWRNDKEIEFKIILKELNSERTRYLVLSKIEKALFFLKSSNKEVEHMIRI